jgi:glycine/D-amino acid oxidase-like deaminating enzyme
MNLRVVVVGAGFAGSVVALLLGRVGVQVTVLKRAAEPTGIGAEILLQPNARRGLRPRTGRRGSRSGPQEHLRSAARNEDEHSSTLRFTDFSDGLNLSSHLAAGTSPPYSVRHRRRRLDRRKALICRISRPEANARRYRSAQQIDPRDLCRSLQGLMTGVEGRLPVDRGTVSACPDEDPKGRLHAPS